MSPIRVLLVDDYKLWRLTVRSILEGTRRFRIVGEAGDGIEAIEKAATLLPDVVLLDIGLPRVNGIEAAQKIRQMSPESTIIYLTQEVDADIQRAALATGAAAYVVKSKAARELLQALETVLLNGNPSRHHEQHPSSVPAVLPRGVELCVSAIEPDSIA